MKAYIKIQNKCLKHREYTIEEIRKENGIYCLCLDNVLWRLISIDGIILEISSYKHTVSVYKGNTDTNKYIKTAETIEINII